MFQDGSAGQQAEAGRRLVHAQDERCEEGGDQRHGDQHPARPAQPAVHSILRPGPGPGARPAPTRPRPLPAPASLPPPVSDVPPSSARIQPRPLPSCQPQ